LTEHEGSIGERQILISFDLNFSQNCLNLSVKINLFNLKFACICLGMGYKSGFIPEIFARAWNFSQRKFTFAAQFQNL
jgi:hypothetical protein